MFLVLSQRESTWALKVQTVSLHSYMHHDKARKFIRSTLLDFIKSILNLGNLIRLIANSDFIVLILSSNIPVMCCFKIITVVT